MKLFVGLGNPGEEYKDTRHNIGYNFLDYYLDYKGIDAKYKKKFNGNYILTTIFDEQVIFLKPLSYMNLSGGVVKKFVDYYKIDLDDIYIICDDLDLKVGNFKFRNRGSSGGHNGLKDIQKALNTNSYKRIRIGIDNDKDRDTKDYVLSKISKEDKDKINEVYEIVSKGVDDLFRYSFTKIMSLYNKKNN